MRIGIAQLNSTVGDLSGNLALAIDAYEQFVGKNIDLVVYPELFLCGYPPRDLLLKENFGLDLLEALNSFASATGPVPALMGYAERIENKRLQPYYNAAAWCVEGNIKQTFHKRLLPAYDVFDETRYFKSGEKDFIIKYNGKHIAVTICEDIWNIDQQDYPTDPITEIAEEKTDLLINLSASPWYLGKEKKRKDLLQNIAQRCKCTVVYVNSVGGNDELIFDGLSMTINHEGKLLFQLPSFAS